MKKNNIVANCSKNSAHIERTRKKLIVLEESGIKITFDNIEERSYRKIKIDGGIVKNTTQNKKSDYLLQKISIGQIIVELKGQNLQRAAEQIADTYNYLKNKTPYQNKTAILIVAKKCPRIGFAEAEKIVKKRCNLILPPVKTSGKNVKFEDFVR